MFDHAVAVTGRVTTDLICFAHLRWDFVYQRPQHLLSRAARTMRVLFWEEPVVGDAQAAWLQTWMSAEGVEILRPQLPWGVEAETSAAMQRDLLDRLIRERAIVDPVLWYYTPLALAFSDHLATRTLVYDCMDELAAFAFADPALPARERDLMARATLVFAGGASLYDARRARRRSVYLFPSGVDAAHFLPARGALPEPADQAPLPHPRVGFFGVLDERLDQDLLLRAAAHRPDLQFVLVGPVVKVDPAALPQRPNIHYLGPKRYDELPAYIAHWAAAMMPFAMNEATRFISPTKTPEYLAAGRPVVSTPVRDVVRAWGGAGGVRIAAEPEAFAEAAMELCALAPGWRTEIDARLREMSWDRIWAQMHALIQDSRAPPAVRLRAPPPCYDHLVVGAGFAGAVLAERLAAGSGRRVLVIDRRPHVGGNAYDAHDAAGVLVHPYGPHIFHTNSHAVFDYLSRFTSWRAYEHRVLVEVNGALLPIPINRQTVNRFFGVRLAADEVEAFLRGKAERVETVRTSADVVLGAVGRELYEAIFRDYTNKQWGLDPSELDKSVAARIPARTSDDDRYFTDRFQCMPLQGYTRMFEAMLDHPNITVATNTDFAEINPGRYRELVFTGPIDAYFGFRFGELPYRSVRFQHETHDRAQFQPVAVVNYPSRSVPHTRVTEFKHLTGQRHRQTSICYEFPGCDGEPYYPVPRAENAALYSRYRALADASPGVAFAYRYLNMDQVVGQALATYARLSGRKPAAVDNWAPAPAAE